MQTKNVALAGMDCALGDQNKARCVIRKSNFAETSRVYSFSCTDARSKMKRIELSYVVISKRFCRIIASLATRKKTAETYFIRYKQDVSPPRASSAKQTTEWWGKELHTGTVQRDIGDDRCPGARYGRTGKGEVEEVKGSDWRMCTEKGGGVTYRYRGISAPVRGTVKLVRGEVEEMKRKNWRMLEGKTRNVGIDTRGIETDRITFEFTAPGCQDHRLGSAQ